MLGEARSGSEFVAPAREGCASTLGGRTACPACASAATRQRGLRYDAAGAANQLCPAPRGKERNAHLRERIRTLWGGESCEMWVCDDCGFGFAQPYVSGDEVFYSLLHEDSSYPSARWEYAPVLRDLSRMGSGGRLLDYGAGDGAFLARLAQGWRGVAVEFSDQLRHRLSRRGFDTMSADSLGTTVPIGSVDVVTMFQVLEHVADFRPLLSWCFNALRPGGRLYVSVPEGARLRQWEAATGLPDLPPFHVSQWTRAALGAALLDAGFTSVATTMDGLSVANVVTLLSNGLRARAVLPTSLAYRAWSVPDRRLRRILLGALAVPSTPRLATIAAQAPVLCDRVILLARAVRREA